MTDPGGSVDLPHRSGKDSTTFAALLEHYLKAKGVSQTELAAKSVFSTPGAVSHWITGRTLPYDAGILVAIIDTLDLNASEAQNLYDAFESSHRLRWAIQIREASERLDRKRKRGEA